MFKDILENQDLYSKKDDFWVVEYKVFKKFVT